MIRKDNGMILVTQAEYAALHELYHNFQDAFRALAPEFRVAFWTALYQPSLRIKE